LKRILPLAFGLFALAAAVPPGRAEWGWPPPGYSAAGLRACDGTHYRGLCALLRDCRHGACPRYVPPSPAPLGPGACALTVSPDGPASPPLTPQPIAPSGGPRP
jgi:hypothetical protein